MQRASSQAGELMTVSELSARTGLSVKAIRRYHDVGLIYSAGRSEAGYRLFDDSALWCAQTIESLRSLGLTIKEIEELTGRYLAEPDEPIGPHLAELLDRAEQRLAHRIAELEAMRRRNRDYRAHHAAALAGRAGEPLAPPDPRRSHVA